MGLAAYSEAAIHDVEAAGFGYQDVEHIDLVHLAIADVNKSGDVAAQIQRPECCGQCCHGYRGDRAWIDAHADKFRCRAGSRDNSVVRMPCRGTDRDAKMFGRIFGRVTLDSAAEREKG